MTRSGLPKLKPRYVQIALNENGEVEKRHELCPDCVEAEADIRKLKRENRRLKNELSERRRQSPHAQEAGQLFDYWVRKRGKNPNRVVYDEKRQERALWAVKHYGYSEAKKVIDAQDVEPWEKDGKVYDDFCTIFKHASAVESFIAIFEEADPKTLDRLEMIQKIPEVYRTHPDLTYLSEKCACEHLRLEHSKSDPFREGFQPCLAAECLCTDFEVEGG